MKRDPETDWKPECSYCGDTCTVSCKTCNGVGCMDCGYRGYKFCPHCTCPGKRKPKSKRRVDIRR